MNVKQKILGRLGLENDEELLNLLDLSNRLDKIKHFYPEFQFSTNNLIEMSWENNGYFKLIGSDNKKTKETTSFRRGWETLLKPTIKNPNNKLGKLTQNPQYFPNGNIPKGDGDEWYFHRGHILARQFHKYVLEYKILNNRYEDTKEKWSQFSIDSKYKNLFTQFSIANKAQAKVEEKVHQILREGNTIYYEVKLVFKNKTDKYPIGTEIFFVPLSSADEFEHYFIPNVDSNFNLEKSKIDYVDFYKDGYSEQKHRPFFENSNRKKRNWQISENETYTIESNSRNFSIKGLSKTTRNSLIKNLKTNLGVTSCKDVQDGEQYKFSGVTLTHYPSTGTLLLQGKVENIKQELLKYLSKED